MDSAGADKGMDAERAATNEQKSVLFTLIVMALSVPIAHVLLYDLVGIFTRLAAKYLLLSRGASLLLDAVLSFMVIAEYFLLVARFRRLYADAVILVTAWSVTLYWAFETGLLTKGFLTYYHPLWYEINMAVNQLIAAAVVIAYSRSRARARSRSLDNPPRATEQEPTPSALRTVGMDVQHLDANLPESGAVRFRFCGSGIALGLLAVVVTFPLWGFYGPMLLGLVTGPFKVVVIPILVIGCPILVFTLVLKKVCSFPVENNQP